MRNNHIVSAKSVAVGLLLSTAAATTVSGAPGDQFVLPIHHFLNGHTFVNEGATGFNGSNAFSHAYTGPGDTSRIYWELNNPGVSTSAQLYLVEWWDATPFGTDGWQPIESQFNGSGGETYPMEPGIPWAGQFGTNHQWVGAEANAIGGGQWRLAGPGPQAPNSTAFNAPGNGFYMWLKSGSQLYAKWDFPFAIADGDPRTWAELRLTQVTPLPLYWDTDGTATPGAGGASPSGNWNGTTSNFNSDINGGTGTMRATTGSADIVVFSAGTNATGNYTVAVSGTRAAAQIRFEEGNATLTGGTLSVGPFDVATGGNGTVNSVVTGGSGGNVVKSGAGTLTLGGVNTHGNGTTVEAGTLIAANANALGTGGLSVATGATAVAQAGLPKALSVASVTAAGTGKLDLTNNDLVVKNSTVAAVQALLVAGFNGGTWNGPGIQSSTAAADPNGFTTLGYLSNADLGATEFSGVTIDADDVLVKYTYYGDADLSGAVTLDDYSQFLFGFQNPVPASWSVGDFDYSGAVTLDDFSVFLLVFQNQGGPLGGLAEAINADTGLSTGNRAAMLGAITAVPEPGTLSVLALSGLVGLRRRRNS